MIADEKIREFRRTLHRYPELSGLEFDTQKRIQAFLKEECGLKGEKIGQTGLLYRFEFGAGKRILARFDIDALPIQEINDFEHKSSVNGVSHKCGHDGHTAIGAGLCSLLADAKLTKGSVDVLFQPAEEIGEGARAVLSDPAFDISRYDFAIAMHNIPGAPLKQVIIKEAEFTPAVHSIILRFQGKTSRAAEPLKGNNPAYIMAKCLLLAQNIENCDEKSRTYGLITPVYSKLGSPDYGISAGYGELHFTLRTWEQHKLEDLTARFLESVEELVKKSPFTLKLEKTAVFAANYNNSRVVEAIANAGLQLNLKVQTKDKPFPWGEDFGLFTQKIPGAMFGLGAGEKCPALHNPDYDYPDQISPTAIALFFESICHLIYEE